MNDKANISSQEEDDEIDLLELFHTLMEGKWWIILFTLLFTLFAFIYAFGQIPIYKADALLQVEKKPSVMAGLEDFAGLAGGEDATVGTEIEIIKSRKNLGKAIKDLKLDIKTKPKRIPLFGNLYKKFFNVNDVKKLPPVWDKFDQFVHKFAWGNEQIDVSRLEVPENLLNKKLTLVNGKNGAYKLFTREGEFLLDGKVGRYSRSKDGSVEIKVRELTGLPGTEYTLIKQSKLNVIGSLQKDIKASEKGKKTGIISLVLEGSDKNLIVKTLDHISKTYVEQNKSRSSEEAKSALEFLQKQIGSVKKEVEKAESRLRLYRTRHQTADISMETQSVLDVISSIDAELQKISLKKVELGPKYAKNHPIIQALAAQEAKLLARKKKTRVKISKLPKTQQELLKLERDYKVKNGTYLNLVNKIQELKVTKASKVGNVYIVDTAVAYEKPVKPKKALILALGSLLGGMFGVLFVFLRKALHQTVDNPEEIEKATGIPVYATVPLSTGVKLTGGIGKRKRQKKLLASENPTDPSIESLRGLRTSLHFALLEAEDNNIVMITGPAPGIGKSFISSNFAAVLASSEKKVLLIDADMRKGYLHNMLGKPVSPGLSDLISEQATLKEAIHTIEVGEESLDVITRGKTPPNPSELLMHKGFKELLDQLQKEYNLILIDTPPVHAVTDPTIIGQLAGVVFMVVFADRHNIKEIEGAVKRLAQSKIETKGFIFNGYDAKKKSYGYGGYGYGYSYYSDYKSDK